MKDFRLRVRQPIKTRNEEILSISQMLRVGHFRKAIRKADRIGYIIPQKQIDRSARKMFLSGRAGELLSLVGKVQVKLPYDTDAMLTRAFQQRDYHSFLKQIHRLGLVSDHRKRVYQAITAISKKRPSEAADWDRKIQAQLLEDDA